nr:hypothetical transcript [Hymenolepis microstoma]
MTTPEKVQIHDNSNAKSSHNAPTDIQMRSPPCLYTFANMHIQKTISPYLRGEDNPSERFLELVSPPKTTITNSGESDKEATQIYG